MAAFAEERISLTRARSLSWSRAKQGQGEIYRAQQQIISDQQNIESDNASIQQWERSPGDTNPEPLPVYQLMQQAEQDILNQEQSILQLEQKACAPATS